ncbi:hypothetical protein MGSAQ_003010 [marine sediment metagenome]|uniref:Uncharacterized protein n=1 Tax=marine sediment metagenome TaxID=412755 RepID=A0A1B6NRF5_9ZZZZ
MIIRFCVAFNVLYKGINFTFKYYALVNNYSHAVKHDLLRNTVKRE